MNRDSVLVVGSSNMDMVLTTENFPKPGETIFAKRFQMFPGGKGANQAVGVAKLCIKTNFITKMGNDEFREKLTSNISAAGVDVNDIIIDEVESTGIALITVNSSGENQIMVVSGSNMRLTPDEIETKKDLFGKAKILLVQLEVPLDAIIKTVSLAKENEMIVILNPAPAKYLPEDLLGKIDYLTPNETELEILSGNPAHDEESIIEAAKNLISKGVKNVIVTVGAKGAMLVNNERTKIFPGKKVKAVDTTAAGDAFNAGLAYGLFHDYTLDESITLANIVAALAVTKMGAQTSMSTNAEVMNIINQINL